AILRSEVSLVRERAPITVAGAPSPRRRRAEPGGGPPTVAQPKHVRRDSHTPRLAAARPETRRPRPCGAERAPCGPSRLLAPHLHRSPAGASRQAMPGMDVACGPAAVRGKVAHDRRPG